MLNCQQLKDRLKIINDLKSQFDSVYRDCDFNRDAKDKDNRVSMDKADKLKDQIEQKIIELEKDILLVEVETKINLRQQYESQRQILKDVGLTQELKNGEEGIIGIDGKDYPILTLEQIIERLARDFEKLKIIETKISQGFSKLLLVPLGMPLSKIIEQYEQVLLKHHQEGKLKATNGEDLDLVANDPIWVWDVYIKKDQNNHITYAADEAGDLIYFPKQFDQENHQGKTKKQLLQDSQAWQAIIIEDLPDLPAQNKGQIINQRKQLEANETPTEYLEALQSDTQYQNEQGMTLESWFAYAITQLQEKDQVIDDWQGNGKICYLTGSFLVPSGYVSNACWDRGNRQSSLDGDASGYRFDNIGARPVVMIS